jgi:hypothetical protein
MILYFHTLYNSDGEPAIATLHNKAKGTFKTLPLYHKDTGITLYEVSENLSLINKVISKSLSKGNKIITSDFKNIIERYELSPPSEVNIYDKLLPVKYHKVLDSFESSKQFVEGVAAKMASMPDFEWQKDLANSSLVYQDMEDRGISISGLKFFPIWNQRVFSGRSSTTAFNIQGSNDEYQIENPEVPAACFLHFDWSCADIRIASIISGDSVLNEFSLQDDPYTAIAEEFNIKSRSQAKIDLLASINSMNPEAKILQHFKGLRDWIVDCRRSLADDEPLETVMGRKFRLSDVRAKKNKKTKKAKNPKLAVFNATMQGSIAHAMHRSIKKVWDEVDCWLLCEVHDSIIITCPNDKVHIKNIIRKVANIMLHPFEGFLDSNPLFPVRVSIGKQWRKWKELKLYNE